MRFWISSPNPKPSTLNPSTPQPGKPGGLAHGGEPVRDKNTRNGAEGRCWCPAAAEGASTGALQRDDAADDDAAARNHQRDDAAARNQRNAPPERVPTARAGLGFRVQG